MMMKPLRNDYGVVIEARAHSDRLADLDTDAVKQAMKESGVVLFRGFDVSIADFEQFTLKFAARMVPNRETYATRLNAKFRDREDVSGDSLTATVNLHKGPIGWHSEDCHLPTSPNILFLYCERPPLRGGATLLTDGIEIFASSEEQIRDYLTRHEFCHTWTFPIEMGALLLGVPPDQVETTANGLKDTLAEGQKLEIDIKEGMITVTFTEPMARTPRWSTQKAFCTRVLLYRVLLETRLREGAALSVIKPEPGDEIEDIFRVLDALAYLHAYHHHWKAQDLLMFDNTRFMHARAPIQDDNRRILCRMCIANF
ncbi:TauD/TfdA family dioxygenase [Pseudomonas syringae]|uniref:TauD/TfdA family dioxygenase n=1 Tax=Pseudomonas syringae TaxID=317 RepID=UPI002248E937|nr:TauD/TfdA family dioxygenase [Pseudomonas syringae]UZS66438.1 TauD/TfdA family dioxygenase [Pseudomonas syringae]